MSGDIGTIGDIQSALGCYSEPEWPVLMSSVGLTVLPLCFITIRKYCSLYYLSYSGNEPLQK